MKERCLPERRLVSALARVVTTTGALVLVAACEPALTASVPPSLTAPGPGVQPVEPPILCQEQHSAAGTAVVVHGAGFAPIAVDIPNAPHVVLPDLALRGAHELFGADAVVGDVLYGGTEGSKNAALLSWQSDRQLTFVVANEVALGEAGDDVGPIPKGLYDVDVKNADRQVATSALSFAITARPSVALLTPPLICIEQGDKTIVVTGTGALRVGEALPVVNAGVLALPPTQSGCRAVAHPGIDAELCDTLTIELAQDALPAGPHAVTITNPAPATCVSTEAVDLVVVPAPTIVSVEPSTVCEADAGVLDLTVSGTGFLRIANDDFAVSVGGIDVVPSSISNCVDVAVTGVAVRSCETFVVSVDAAAFPVGVVDVTVSNPAPADCSASTSALFEVLPSPRIDDVAPPSACALDGGVDLAVSGDGFLRNGATNFTVTIGGVTATPTAIADCRGVVVQGVTMDSCTSFVVTVDPALLASGPAALAVTNPAPDACGSSRADVFEVLPSPAITSVSPNAVCSVGAGVVGLTVAGTDFLRDVVGGGGDFAVTVGGAAVVPTSITGCAPVVVAGASLERCTGFSVAVDAGAFPPGNVALVVTSAAPDGCIGAASAAFAVLPPPTVTAVVPTQVCSDVLIAFDVVGTNFASATTVTIDGRAASTASVNADGTTLSVTYDPGFAAGLYDVTVSNGGDCTGTLAAALLVNATPLVFFVDPPVLFNGIDLEATIFASGVDGLPNAVELIDGTGNVTSVGTFTSDPARRSRIRALIEAGLLPGDYAVRVTSELGCPSALNGSVSLTDALTITLGSVDPEFVSPTVATAVTVTASGAVLFENLPRVYLSPQAGGNAIALRAVELNAQNPAQLSAIATGATPGIYDLIVVNPSGAVGFLPGAVTVAALEPPLVTSVAPGSLNAGQVSTADINGANFDLSQAPSTLPVVSFECQDFATGALVAAPASVTVNAAGSSATLLAVTIDAAATPAGSACIAIVTNPDGATFRFSAVSFRNPSQNLNPFRDGSAMLEARRALVLAAGRPTEISRFLYAVGGDNGSAATAKATVEAAPVDPFGVMGTWDAQRNSLLNAFDGTQTVALPRTLAGGARVGRFIYVVGGNDGTASVATVLRAQILDPLAGPEVLDLDAELGDGVIGMPAGLWLYRVSALFPTSDASNPGGESLAGELFNVELPAIADLLLITLTWEQVPGASGYRIYRTPGPDETAAGLELLTTLLGVASVSFTDDDTGVTDPASVPLPAGSTGVWHALTGSPLATPREAPATLAVQRPADASQFFLYAVGGNNGTTTLATGEVATVSIAADQSQTVSTWRALSDTLNPARSESTALSVSGADTPVAATNTFVFFVGGRLANGNDDDTIEGSAIDPVSGDIATLSVMSARSRGTGAAGTAANGFLFVFGGQGGSGATDKSVSSELVSVTAGVPTLDNFNALGGGGINSPRFLPASAQESAFFFVGGGFGTDAVVVDANAPLASIEQTIQ
jgi:hypothetical protein